MSNLLSEVGYDLATAVEQYDLDIVDLHLAQPKVNGYPFLDYLLLQLTAAMNSVFLVDRNADYVQSYTSSLALLFDDTQRLIAEIQDSAIRQSYHYSAEQEIDRRMKALVGRRLYAVDSKLLISMCDSFHKVDAVFHELITATQRHRHIFVFYGMNEIFKQETDEFTQYLARGLFFATRGKVQLTFIAPLSWSDYVHDIERGWSTLLIQHRTPFLFSPRPADLPLPDNQRHIPDNRFDFGK